MGLFGATLVTLLVLAAIFAPLISPYDPIEQHPGSELLPPGGQFFLGTDNLGRDLLSRIIWGSRSSLLIGLVAVGLGAGIGIVSVLGTGGFSVAYALAFATLPGFARLMRSRVLTERERDYVTAARCIGAGDNRIMWQHVLPNAIAPLLVQITLAMSFSVLAESGLSFLGLGTQPPQPSWGSMLNESRAYLRTAAGFGVFPGMALALLLLGLNFLTDALRDALDPRRVNAQ
jgi:peptide/nickel transport system permease protein